MDWKSSKQKTITTSSTEAELLALTDAVKEVYHWMRVFRSMHLDLAQDVVPSCDNLQTIRVLSNGTHNLLQSSDTLKFINSGCVKRCKQDELTFDTLQQMGLRRASGARNTRGL